MAGYYSGSGLVSLTVALVCILGQVNGLDNGLALTPPMGFMTWQRFRCTTDCKNFPNECVSEALIKRTVDAMVRDGFKAAGYEYVIIDDCWLEKERDNVTGRLVANHHRFPSGMLSLGQYIHSKGLKFGLYEDYGTHTCAGYPGSIHHMELDTKTFAEWGVDYIKLDGCNADISTMEWGYPEFGMYMNKTNRPMVYSCSWPAYLPDDNSVNYTAIAKHCNLWRNWVDIDDSYTSFTDIMNHFGNRQDQFLPNAGIGAWNDPDMLVIGNYGLSIEQAQIQMAVWSVLAAPLLISADLDTMRPEDRAILLNADAIAINQDRLGKPGRRVYNKNNQQVWVRFLADDSVAVVLVNHNTDGMPRIMSFNPSSIGINKAESYSVKNVFHKEETYPEYKPASQTKLKYRVNVTGCVFLRFDPAGKL